MKLLSNLRNRLRKNLVNNQRGQGATEYILLLVVVVGLVMVFGPKVKTMVGDKMDKLSEDVGSVTTDI